MNKTALGVIVIILLAFLLLKGSVLKKDSKQGTKDTPPITNADILESRGKYKVETSEPTYFENAIGFLAKPSGEGKFPGVVMIHENRGLRPEIKSMAEQLAKEGYMVLAVDLYKGKVAETQEEAKVLSVSFDQETAVANLKSAVSYLKKKGATKIASLGWCFGGKQSVALAISGEKFDATVVYYGGGMASTVEELKPIKWPVLGIFGDKDQVIPVEKVKEFESSLKTLGIKNEIYIYQGVGHAFANPSGTNYAPKETKDAWEKTVVFLNKHLQ